LNQLLQAERVVVAHETGCDLHVEDIPRQLADVLHTEGQVLLPGVNHGLNSLVGHQLPDRLQVELEKRIDQRHPLLRGDLQQANLGLVAVLHHELGIEGESSFRSDRAAKLVKLLARLDKRPLDRWVAFLVLRAVCGTCVSSHARGIVATPSLVRKWWPRYLRWGNAASCSRRS
jgi:hypothetical protein